MDSQLSFTVAVDSKTQRSVLQHCYTTPPFKLMTLPQHNMQALMPAHALFAMQMSASPGILAHDCLEINIELHTAAACYFATQAFTRVLSMPPNAQAHQKTHITLAPLSTFVYLPHPLVLHSGAHLNQHTQVTLSQNCTLVLGEIIACGRVLNDEKFAFHQLSSTTHIYAQSTPLILDNIQWHPTLQPLDVMGQMEDFTHQASLYLVALDTTQNMQTVLDTIVMFLEEQQAHYMHKQERLLLGASLLNPEVMIMRGLACHAEVLQHILMRCTELFLAAIKD